MNSKQNRKNNVFMEVRASTIIFFKIVNRSWECNKVFIGFIDYEKPLTVLPKIKYLNIF